jgi:hypothetical protein
MTKSGYVSTPTTSLSEAQQPIVLALDVGTSSVRAMLYDVRGREIQGADNRTPYQMCVEPFRRKLLTVIQPERDLPLDARRTAFGEGPHLLDRSHCRVTRVGG